MSLKSTVKNALDRAAEGQPAQLPVLPPIPPISGAHASPARRREREYRDKTQKVAEAYKAAGTNWKLSTTQREGLEMLMERGAATSEEFAKLNFKPSEPGPTVPEEVESAEHRAHKIRQHIRQAAAKGGIVPLSENSWRRMLAQVPAHLRNRKVCPDFPNMRKCDPNECGHGCTLQLVLNNLDKEVHELYEANIRKGMVLRVTEPEDAVKGILPEGLDFSSEYGGRYDAAHRALSHNLRIVHPAIREVLVLWQTFVNRTLVNFGEVVASLAVPVTIEGFETATFENIEESEEILHTQWFPKILTIFSGLPRPGPGAPELLGNSDEERAPFYKSANALMAIEVEGLMNVSIMQFAADMADQIRRPKFDISLVLSESGEYSFKPSQDEMEASLQRCLDKVSKSLQTFTPIDAWIAGLLRRLRVVADDETLAAARVLLTKTVGELYEPLKEWRETYAKYAGVVPGGEDTTAVEAFCTEEHTLSEFQSMVAKYTQIGDEVRGLQNVEMFGSVYLNCQPLIAALEARCKGLVVLLLTRLTEVHTTACRKICKGYETIRRKALKEPEDSKEMIDLVAYMDRVKTKDLFDLKEAIKKAQHTMRYILEAFEFTAEETALNSAVHEWPVEILPVIDESEIMMEKAKTRGEETLMKKRETLIGDIEKLRKRLKAFESCQDASAIENYLKEVGSIERGLASQTAQVAQINKEEELFKWEATSYPAIKELQAAAGPFRVLYEHIARWQKSSDKWYNGVFEALDGDVIGEETDEFWRETYKSAKQYSAATAMYKLLDVVKKEISAFKEHLPMVRILCNPGLRERHWKQMSEAVGDNITPNSSTTLNKMIALELGSHMEKLEGISGGASKEFSLEKAMNKMEDEWKPLVFGNSTYRDTGFAILASVDDIQAQLDDHIVKTQTMKGSPFIKPFKERIELWEHTLVEMQDIIDGWLKMQATWLYLEPIFSSPDIMAQMPKEGELFINVDGRFKSIMAHMLKDPSCLTTCKMPGMLDMIVQSNEDLELIIKGLNDYLEKKRLYFARFFFLSNDEMLEILSETKDPTRVQPHLKKCFEGISKLTFTDDLDITHMISSEKEIIELNEVISTTATRGKVEEWLLTLEGVMKRSVRDRVSDGVQSYMEMDRVEWIKIQPGQVALCVGQTYWTIGMHTAIRTGVNAIKEYWDKQNEDLRHIVDLVRGKIPKLIRATCEAMVTMDVHARDVTLELYEKKCGAENDFNWLAQLRYYWEGPEDDKNMLARMINSTCKYAYEYLGNSFRLVVTPLTDRCYRTLIGAYYLHLGGAPEGPAGTGKTETTKDLAKAIGIQCVVFNCSDGLDYIAMGKFFKGLAQSGAWSCFDEFNRIEIEVLSVIAQQLITIKTAVDANAKQFVFEGTLLDLNPTCCSFITMNPGYAGRSELPDNLKVLFRTVAMMVPNYAMIAEIQLYSCGYIDARALGYKIVTTYKLCSEQLSSQFHYDYGMRAVKAVLRSAADLKLKFPDEAEATLMLRAIVAVNLPKFLSHDIPLFNGIISDLFPGIPKPNPDYDEFNEAAAENCKKLGLQLTPSFLNKLQETYEMLLVRHGFMLVGLPYAAKTMVLKVLSMILGTLTDKHEEIGDLIQDGDPIYRKAQYSIINPKAITMGQLFGCFDPVSHEWTDGIVPNEFRRMATDTSPDRHWVWFDGPVDTLWIESMNTVLDDNKKLCLMSGEIIAMSGTMSMIFENMDLSQASPATVSRCGMIYLEPVQLGWRALKDSWVEALPEAFIPALKDLLHELFDTFVDPLLEFVNKSCTLMMPVDDLMLVNNLLRYFLAITAKPFESENNAKVLDGWVRGAFLFSVVWSIGAPLNRDSRLKFDEYFRQLYSNQVAEHSHEIKFPTPFPDDGLVYDFMFQVQGKGKFLKWIATVSSELKLKPGQKLKDALVPTVDTARYMHMMEMFVENRIPVLFCGPTGTGKSVYCQAKIMSLPKEKYAPMFLTFSARTSANVTQNFIMSKLDKRRRGHFGPRMGMHAIAMIDDLNMPQVEQYGAQPPIEILRTLLDHHFWSDLTDTTRMDIHDVLVVAAMGPPGGGRNHISSRLVRHMHVIGVADFDDESRSKIFTTVLQYGMRDGGFPMEVQTLSKPLVEGTLRVFREAVVNLLPTPAKSHYLFNLRDFARVINGVLMLPGKKATDKNKVIRLWTHEVLRVFSDRLTDEEDRLWLHDLIADICKETFKSNHVTIFAPDGGVKKITLEHMESLKFGVYVHPQDNSAPYDECLDEKSFYDTAKDALDEYNQINKTPMELVIFKYVLMHLSRVCRVLKQDGGHALLVGVGGSGRQSIARLAAQVLGYDLFQPEITKTYGMPDWKDDVRSVLRKAGAEDRKIVLLINDTQIKEEAFLEDIDALLNSGEVANIFPTEERVEILEMVNEAANAAAGGDIELTPLELYAFFVSRCRDNMHIVLGMSPIGAALRTRLRMFPSLVNCCTIDWFDPWPKQALQMVATVGVESVEMDDKERATVVEVCQFFQSSIQALAARFRSEAGRIVYVTPTSFLELIKAFKGLLQDKRDEILGAKERYLTGLDKIEFAESQVSDMQKELSDLQPKLVIAKEENVKMTAQIEKESAEAAEMEVVITADEKAANEQAAVAQGEKEECEALLAEAIPALNSALKALDTLKKADMDELKGIKLPTDGVRLVMEAVCVIKDVKPVKIDDPKGGLKKVNDYWGPAKKMLADMKFLQSLKDFDKDNINPKLMEQIREKYIPDPMFDPSKVAKASLAAEGLCRWVTAMEVYDRVAKVVAPKRIALAQKEKEVKELMALLKTKQDSLAAVKAQVAKLNEALDLKTKEKEELENKVQDCALKLDRAKKLIKGLGGEKVRWGEAAEALGEAYVNVTGDILLSAGVLAYIGPFTPNFREIAVKDWVAKCVELKLPCSKNFNLTSTVGDPVKTRQWLIDGLPSDSLSIDNGTIISRARRWPLAIDPQGQANKWIKNMESENKLAVIKLTEDTYMRTLENCIQFGTPVLMENVLEELDPSLEGLLLKSVFKVAGVQSIKLGDNVIEYSPDFRFYVTTKLPNPHYTPDVATKVTLLNFMITKEGLEDQLLGIVVAKERPEVEEERQQLVVTSAANKKALKEVEDRILHTLKNAEGNILENAEAVAVLDEAKRVSDDINAKQKVADETADKIEQLRAGYTPVAQHSSILFFVVAAMADIDPMYQYSLTWFVSLFNYSIRESNKSRELSKRLRFLSDHFTYTLYVNVCRSLFEKDKLLFSFVLCADLMKSRGALNIAEFSFFLTGGVGLETPIENPDPTWLSKKMWDEACRANDLSMAFTGLATDIKHNNKAWKALYDSKTPQTLTDFPEPWQTKLTFFQKMILLRVLRPDKVVHAVRSFVEDNLGRKFVEPPPFDLVEVFNDSTKMAPLVFILSPGADPMAAMMKFAGEKGYVLGENFHQISLGQGQGPIAERMIMAGKSAGHWVCLQNCHLATSWMPELERICEKLLEDAELHDDFRLWLTSYPSKDFPVAVLQNGAKMTNEPPDGLKQNMRQSYLNDPVSDPEFFNYFNNDDQQSKYKNFQKMLFGLTFFHANVQERRTFGPIGWNIPYGFNESDFRISVQQLKIFFDECVAAPSYVKDMYDDVPYDALQYCTGQCNYGGRVTDDWDRRCLTAILANAFGPPVVEEAKYKFSPNPEFYVPPPDGYESYLDWISEMPAVMPPETYGMHDNVDITKETLQTKVLFDSVLTTQTKAGGADSGGNVATVASSILSRMPQQFDVSAAMKKFPVLYEESMNTVLVQEMQRFNRLIKVVRSTLTDLGKALEGKVVMTSDLEDVMVGLSIGKIPAIWSKSSYPSLRPLGSYVTDLLRRLDFFQTWYKEGKPSCFWLPGFFFTQAFLTGVLQNYARKYTIAIDTLSYDFEVLQESPQGTGVAPEDGAYIYGLYLDGARWDANANSLAESEPKVLFSLMADMWFKPAVTSEISTEGTYTCPVYKTSERKGVLATTGHSSNFVLPVQIPSKLPESHWVLRGVALLTQLDD